jgi:hypothetical protein
MGLKEVPEYIKWQRTVLRNLSSELMGNPMSVETWVKVRDAAGAAVVFLEEKQRLAELDKP